MDTAVKLVLIVTLALGTWTAPAHAGDGCDPGDFECSGTSGPPTTEGDQGTGSVVTEGVQFPGVSADSALGKATAAHANCGGCEWVISPACLANAAGDSAACAGATIACADPDAIQYRVYFRPNATAAWQLVD